MSDTTTRLTLPFMEGTDAADDIDQGFQDLAETLDGVVTGYSQGSFAARPVSTPGSPGTAGWLYYVTGAGANAGVLYWDYGTGWLDLSTLIADGAVTSAKLAALAVVTAKINDLAVTTGKLADGAATDAKIASPNNSAYKTLLQGAAGAQGATSGSTALLTTVFYLDPADCAVSGKTTKYRVRVAMGINGISPLSTFTVGLYPVTGVGGGSGSLTPTLGTVIAGSTAGFGINVQNTLNESHSGDFTAPVAGFYAVAVAVSVSNMAAGSVVNFGVAVEQRNV